MAKFSKGVLLAGIASLLLGSVASAQLTSAEAKCQLAASKAASKFVGAKTKCASKCISNASKGLNPYSDCTTPYGGATAECINDTVLDKKGAENKFRDAIRKACDPTFKDGTDCPECYSGGDCTTEASDRVQSIEGQVDAFGPGVFCEQTPSADKLELKCELNTAKVLAKLVKSINTCFEKCYSGARKVPPLNPATDCVPPGAGATGTCVSTAEDKAIAAVDKKCGDVGAIPDCPPGTDNYPAGASWVNLVSTAISGNIPVTFCPD